MDLGKSLATIHQNNFDLKSRLLRFDCRREWNSERAVEVCVISFSFDFICWQSISTSGLGRAWSSQICGWGLALGLCGGECSISMSSGPVEPGGTRSLL